MININFKHTVPGHEDYSKELSVLYNTFSKYVKDGDWSIDIGAALGDTTLVLAELVGDSGKVLSFEPSITYNLLLENIKNNINLINRIKTYQFGAYTRNCTKKIVTNYFKDNGGIVDDLFATENRNRLTNSYDINVVNMNSFLFEEYSEEERKKIKFIKIDTEGLDFLILNNLRPFIDKYKPIIFIEWWPNQILSDVIFDIVSQINYLPIRDDNFQEANPEDFLQRSQNIILRPK